LKRRQYPPPKHIVPLDKKTLKELGKYIIQEDLSYDDPLFRFGRTWGYKIVRETGKRAGIVKVGSKTLHPHHLRHSHCVAYIRRNNSMEGLRTLQKRIGHYSILTTASYLQFGSESKEDTEDIFGEF